MKPIRANQIRYMKLGAGGRWEKRAIERGEIYFGMPGEPHTLVDVGNWEGVAKHFQKAGYSVGMSSYIAREHREFETFGTDCLWITFSSGCLWWGFAEPKVRYLGGDGSLHGTRMRRIIDGWRNTDIHGALLTRENLSTKLTQVAAYRHTMCSVREGDYLLRKINGTEEPMVARAGEVRKAMISVASEAIASLHWADFENLIDLIFARTGWQRRSRVGGTQKDLDLEMEQPTTLERAFVQVKSQACQADLEAYVARFDSGNCDRMFFICHTPRGNLCVHDRPDVHIWARDALASAAVRAGLYDWVIQKIA